MNTELTNDADASAALPSGFFLAADGEMSPAVALGLPTTHKELPIHYRWNRVTKAGRYRHPVTGETFDLNAQTSSKWAKSAKLALSNGFDIPASKVHGLNQKPYGYKKPENTLGAIYDARERDGELELLTGFYGDEAFDIARKNKVSIGIERNVKDAKGNVYDELLTHLAITPTPVLPNLPNGFVTLSREASDELNPDLPAQPKGVEMLDAKLKPRVTAYLPNAGEDVNEVLTGLLDKLDANATASTALSRERDEARTQLNSANQKLALASEGEPDADPRIAALTLRAYRADVNADVASGAYSKATGDLLLSSFMEGDKPNAVLLSREDASPESASMFNLLRKIAKAARPGHASGERTGSQSTLLSREVPDDQPKQPTVQDRIEAGREEGKAFAAKHASPIAK